MHSITVTAVGETDPLGYLQDDPEPSTPAAPLLWHLTEGWKQPGDILQPLVVHLEPGVDVVAQLFLARDTSGYDVLVHRLGQDDLTTLEGEPWTPPEVEPPARRKRSS